MNIMWYVGLGEVLAWLVHIREFLAIGFLFFLLLYRGFYLSQTNACLPEADLFIPGSDVLGTQVLARNNVLDAYYHPGHWGYIWGDEPGSACVWVCNALNSVYELYFTLVNSGIPFLKT